MAEPRTHEHVHPGRPWTVNNERKLHPLVRAALVRTWRAAFAGLARAEHLPRLGPVRVTVTPHLADRRGRQDVGGCMPAAKAAIDGIVDAGVLPDDTPAHVVALTFRPPVYGRGDALAVVLEEVGRPDGVAPVATAKKAATGRSAKGAPRR